MPEENASEHQNKLTARTTNRDNYYRDGVSPEMQKRVMRGQLDRLNTVEHLTDELFAKKLTTKLGDLPDRLADAISSLIENEMEKEPAVRISARRKVKYGIEKLETVPQAMGEFKQMVEALIEPRNALLHNYREQFHNGIDVQRDTLTKQIAGISEFIEEHLGFGGNDPVKSLTKWFGKDADISELTPLLQEVGQLREDVKNHNVAKAIMGKEHFMVAIENLPNAIAGLKMHDDIPIDNEELQRLAIKADNIDKALKTIVTRAGDMTKVGTWELSALLNADEALNTLKQSRPDMKLKPLDEGYDKAEALLRLVTEYTAMNPAIAAEMSLRQQDAVLGQAR